MHYDESRRITGPTLVTDGFGAAIELHFEPDEPPELRASVLAAWQGAVLHLHHRLGWPAPTLFRRDFGRGVTLGFRARPDVLYAACELNEWALRTALHGHGLLDDGAGPPSAEDEAVTTLAEAVATEQNPALLALMAAADTHGAPWLVCDDWFSLGYGVHARTWPVRQLPSPDAVDWSAHGRVPLVMLTGTNGKTTSSRLLVRILMAAGHRVGGTSTDAITLDGQVLDAGDWTGPGAARTILRDPRVTAAVLETARGGILRRGLALSGHDVALVTNVAADHMGDWGIDDLDAMARAKLTVARHVRPDGAVVLNADDANLVRLADQAGAPIIWFTLQPDGALVTAHLAAGGRAVFVQDGQLVLAHGAERLAVLPVADVPITFGGAAAFNVANALGAAASAWGLGVAPDAIAAGLRAFRPTEQDNPGRSNLWRLGGVTLMADFAHNPHGVRAVFDFVNRAHPTGRRVITLGQAGDRDDEALRALAATIHEGGVHHAILRPLHKYLRGRAEFEVPEVLAAAFRRLGLPDEAVEIAPDELGALDRALAAARPGDLVLLFLTIEREAVRARIEALGGHAIEALGAPGTRADAT